MQIPKNKWYNAISQRCSRRQFDGRTISHDLLYQLINFSQSLNEQVHGVRAVIVTEKPDEIFKGAVGSYGKIKGAPAYVAFLGNMKDSHVHENVGILGEIFILETTSIGLATCWVGGFFRPDVVKAHIQVHADEQVLAVSPIGFAKEQLTFEEKIMVGLASSRNRKNIETLFLSVPEYPLPDWISTALEAARLAPSALNRQPWRFSIEKETIKVSVDNNRHSAHVSKRLDCGIAMAHIEIGAKHKGVAGHWEYLTGLDVARFKPLV